MCCRAHVHGRVLFPPGRILHLIDSGQERCCSRQRNSFVAVWADRHSFSPILVSPRNVIDHVPWYLPRIGNAPHASSALEEQDWANRRFSTTSEDMLIRASSTLDAIIIACQPLGRDDDVAPLVTETCVDEPDVVMRESTA